MKFNCKFCYRQDSQSPKYDISPPPSAAHPCCIRPLQVQHTPAVSPPSKCSTALARSLHSIALTLSFIGSFREPDCLLVPIINNVTDPRK